MALRQRLPQGAQALRVHRTVDPPSTPTGSPVRCPVAGSGELVRSVELNLGGP